ncbi:MAG: hypothetical protein ACRD3Q_02660 [Terriglobales bacterium]
MALETLICRLPDLCLAEPFERIRFLDTAIVYGVEELLVTW